MTGEIGDRGSLLRFVVGPANDLVPDVSAKLPGRGLWLTPRRDIVERAVAKRVFSRVARQSLTVPAGLGELVEGLLVRRCCDGLGLARRAGIAVAGFEKVRGAARAGRTGLLLAALDGAEGSRRKLRALRPDLPLASVLTAAEIGSAFGRDHVVNALVGAGPLSRRIIADAEKLAGFRAQATVDRGTERVRPGRRGGTMALERDERRD